jgi:hypothetical protein
MMSASYKREVSAYGAAGGFVLTDQTRIRIHYITCEKLYKLLPDQVLREKAPLRRFEH